MKQNVIAPLFVVVIASVIGGSEATSCYRCNYTDLPEKLGPSTCDDPFNAATSPKCSSSYCLWSLSNYTDQNNAIYHLLNRDCANDTYRASFNCGLFSGVGGNCSSFNYGDKSCYSIQVEIPNVFVLKSIACFCNTDYCNGDLPYTMLPDATTMLPNTNKSPGKPSNAMAMLKPFAGMWFALLVALAVRSYHLALPCQQR